MRACSSDASHLIIAGVAQLVERDLAKVEVTSSSLVTRSKSTKRRPLCRRFAILSFYLA
jgi:hypothetical protein